MVICRTLGTPINRRVRKIGKNFEGDIVLYKCPSPDDRGYGGSIACDNLL